MLDSCDSSSAASNRGVTEHVRLQAIVDAETPKMDSPWCRDEYQGKTKAFSHTYMYQMQCDAACD